MSSLEPRTTARRWTPHPCGRSFPRLVILALALSPAAAVTAAEAPVAVSATVPEADDPLNSATVVDKEGDDDVVSLAAYNVQADRIEDFGLRVGRAVAGEYPKTIPGFMVARFVPIVVSVLPNTAAAKAGLQPGDRIMKADGRSTSVGLMSAVQLTKWRNAEKAKWAEVAAGKANVAWTFEILSPGAKTTRTVKLTVPTPPPHWGAAKWQAPQGRVPATVREPGPLAERSRAILDHGLAVMIEERLTEMLGLDFRRGPKGDFTSGRQPAGYSWVLVGNQKGTHRMIVTQFRGRTDIFLEARGPGSFRIYHTSPSGALEKAWGVPQRGQTTDPLEEARAGFAHELALWVSQVQPGTGRWPFEVKPGYEPDTIFATLAPPPVATAAPVAPPLAEAFLKLRAATEAERALFADARGRLGADHGRWAYTDTSRGLEDKRELVTRVDPSQPEGQRVTLITINGKKPKPAEIAAWREEGGDLPKPLGDVPALDGLLDFADLRIQGEDTAAVVFEAPLRGGGDFPADKFQAFFRVNRTTRAFEDITVRQRESFSVGGVVKIAGAGLHARFQSLDPALPPQPVFLRGGGAARVLFVKLSRDFETTRSDYKLVGPASGSEIAK